MKHLSTLKSLLLVLFAVLGGVNAWGQESQVLFHETFGNNSTNGARAWSDSYSEKSGVEDVYSGITGYTIANVKQGKTGTGQTKSGLNQSSSGTDASIIIGPLNTANCSSMVLSYYWKAGSIKGAYSSSAYYATSSGGTYTKLGDASGGIASTFVKQSFDMPTDAQVNTLYLKIVWNTSNTQAIIDEVDLSGVYTTDPSAPQKPASPTFSLAEGTHYGNQTLEITTTVDGGTIYYTTDGSDPTTSGIEYPAAITIFQTTTVNACVKDSEGNYSDVVTRTYTIVPSIANTKETAFTTAEAIALIDKTSTDQLEKEMVYVKGTVSKVDSYNSSSHSITYWLDDNAFEVYSGKGLDGADFSAKTDVEVGAEVIVYGNIKKFNTTTYEFDQNNYLVKYTAPAPKVISSVEITGAATKTTYEVGETFSRSGLTLTVTYDDASTQDVTSDATWTISPKTLNEIGTTQVIVTATYKEKTATKIIDVTVTAPQPAALPFTFDSGKSAISTTQGMSQTGLGSGYDNSPKLQFDGSDDELVIYYNGPASYLGYTIKGNGFNGGTFSVMESANGVNYTNVALYTELAQVNKACMNALKSSSRYVKFVYTNKSKGNVALGKIEISDDKTPVTVSAAGYATYFNSAKAYTMPVGCEGYVFSEGKLSQVYKAEAVVPANEPLVIKAEAGTYELKFTTSEKETYKSVNMNDLEGTDKETALTADDNYYFYGLSLNKASDLSSVGFYWMNETGAAFTNGAHKAYLKLAKSNAARAYVFGDEETAIESVEAETANEEIFDLSGRKVSKAVKGLYIINGKKVVK